MIDLLLGGYLVYDLSSTGQNLNVVKTYLAQFFAVDLILDFILDLKGSVAEHHLNVGRNTPVPAQLAEARVSLRAACVDSALVWLIARILGNSINLDQAPGNIQFHV